jgi:hypothetical protein
MRRFLHAGQFRDKFASLRADYENTYSQQIQRIRGSASDNPTSQPPPIVDECLEYHARTYIINGMFEALNWPLQSDEGLPAFVPEAQIESLERGTRRFLDYFGLSPTTQKPLIVVEAKRPSLSLPSDENLPETIASGLREQNLGEVWNEILSSIQDYVNSVTAHFGYSPHRVGITNGSWLILFLDPIQTFVNGNVHSGAIVVFADPNEIYSKAAEVWEYLEYTNVAGKIESRSCDLGELPFRIEPRKIKRITLGLKLIYFESPTQYKPRPQINILPIVLIGSQDDLWIYIQRNNHSGFDLPHRYEELGNHLREVNHYIDNLVAEVAQNIQIRVDLSPITAHYEQDESIFKEFRGVNDITAYSNKGIQQFIIVTGTESHFLRETPSVVDCIYHAWANSQEEGVAAVDVPVVMASISMPKSFFLDGQDHHCTHATVLSAKTSQLNHENRQRCGLRSNPDGAAFCEIIQIEEYLCCRTCVFENVCTKAELFHLPCNRQ